jgi:hypothetical protein
MKQSLLVKACCYLFYGVCLFTPLLMILREYFGGWIYEQQFRKEFGPNAVPHGYCLGGPPFLLSIVVLAAATIAICWARSVLRNKQNRYLVWLQLFLILSFFMLPFTWLDLKLAAIFLDAFRS